MNQQDAQVAGAGDPAALVVQADSHVTLHYRVSLADTGDDVFNTFGARPATLALGLGQLVEPLERCLVGMAEGRQAVFELPPGQAFGERNPALLQRLARALLDTHRNADAPLAVGDLVDFPAPGGGRYAGVVRELDERGALVDFNHPLAGQPIRFEVRILGVL
jgi:FKBP-type peptidyl-prolyl cis-trans isomerase SlpA